MANIAYRRKRKNNTGSYDTVYYETDSRIVIRPNGESVETSLNKTILSSEKNQPNGIATLNDNSVLDIKYGGTGSKIAQEAIYNLGCGVRPNLLDNWYFVGGGSQLGNNTFPINQRGKIRYTDGQIFDRYILYNATLLALNDGANSQGISVFINNFGGTFVQIPSTKLDVGSIYTLSVLANGVSATCSIGAYDGGETPMQNGLTVHTFRAQENVHTGGVFLLRKYIQQDTQASAFIYAAKLEKGFGQTLAYPVNDGTGIAATGWALFEKPDYRAEVAKCRKYVLNFTPDSINASYTGICSISNNLVVNIPLPVQMRLERPSLVWDISNVVVEHKGEKKPVNSAFIAATSSNSITIVLNVSGVEVGDVGNLQLSTNDDQQQWIIDASL